jgi:hypothetical protein
VPLTSRLQRRGATRLVRMTMSDDALCSLVSFNHRLLRLVPVRVPAVTVHDRRCRRWRRQRGRRRGRLLEQFRLDGRRFGGAVRVPALERTPPGISGGVASVRKVEQPLLRLRWVEKEDARHANDRDGRGHRSRTCQRD